MRMLTACNHTDSYLRSVTCEFPFSFMVCLFAFTLAFLRVNRSILAGYRPLLQAPLVYPARSCIRDMRG